jgi:hypothetical protein
VSYRLVLNTSHSRDRAKRLIESAPNGYVFSVEEPRRTLSQNDRLWALLSDVAMSKPMGRMHTPEEWKCIFMAACGWEVAFLPGLDGRFLPYGYRSSKLTKKQMTDLQDFISAWGAENGVRWSNEAKQEAADAQDQMDV